jgi:serine/threonine protein phosphatase 1
MHLKRFSRNTAGRDLIVGDIHGNVTKLLNALEAIGFDATRDRLFSVGDLVDRGPESEHAVALLEHPWFHAVRGNHEQMAIDWASGMARDADIYMRNGGAWFLGQPKAEQLRIAGAFSALPIAIELETAAGLVGIVHADCPLVNWEQLEEALGGFNAEAVQMACMWSRDRIESRFCGDVHGVVAVVVGHTPLERCTSLGNTIYIDTGGWLPERHGPRQFTILDASTLQPLKLPAPQLAWS